MKSLYRKRNLERKDRKGPKRKKDIKNIIPKMELYILIRRMSVSSRKVVWDQVAQQSKEAMNHSIIAKNLNKTYSTFAVTQPKSTLMQRRE